RLTVTNKMLPRFWRWTHRQAAVNAYGYIDFYDEQNKIFVRKGMPIKWFYEPGVERLAGDHILIRRFRDVSFLDVHPGEKQPIDVVSKYDADNVIYGWTYENYFSHHNGEILSGKLMKVNMLLELKYVTAATNTGIISDYAIKKGVLSSLFARERSENMTRYGKRANWRECKHFALAFLFDYHNERKPFRAVNKKRHVFRFIFPPVIMLAEERK
ncbi:MAG: hypothetical protein U1D67_05840, partial [Dehalococcoidia bacterium]|nr:hypothetical protein [Dehalococcoidia bacterium]